MVTEVPTPADSVEHAGCGGVPAVWSRPSKALAQLEVPRRDSSWMTGAWASISCSHTSYLSRSYARLQMHSKSCTSHFPSRVPPHGPLRWFLAHCDSGQRNVMSGSEQSPQSLQRNIAALLACSSTRSDRGPWNVSRECE